MARKKLSSPTSPPGESPVWVCLSKGHTHGGRFFNPGEWVLIDSAADLDFLDARGLVAAAQSEPPLQE
jgi:hypothetical protein